MNIKFKTSFTLITLFFTIYLNGETALKKETLEKNLAVDSSFPASLEFTDVEGNVRFSSWDKNFINIRVTKEVKIQDSRRAEILLRETKVEFSQKKNEIRVQISYPKMKGFFFWLRDHSRIKVSTEIRLPEQSNVYCHTVNGSIHGENITGKVMARTTDGSIFLSHIQDLIKAKTTNGRIIMKNIKGTVDIKTKDGNIELSGEISKLTIYTASGDVSARIFPGSLMEENWIIESQVGNVDFFLWPEFSADFFFKTLGGEITNKIPLAYTDFSSKRKISGIINQGSHLLRIKTSEGNITLHRLNSKKL